MLEMLGKEDGEDAERCTGDGERTQTDKEELLQPLSTPPLQVKPSPVSWKAPCAPKSAKKHSNSSVAQLADVPLAMAAWSEAVVPTACNSLSFYNSGEPLNMGVPLTDGYPEECLIDAGT